jgi:hypothetical protein
MKAMKFMCLATIVCFCALACKKDKTLGSITVRAEKTSNGAPIQGATINLSTNSSYDETKTTPASGEVTFDDLPSDEYFYYGDYGSTFGSEGHFVLSEGEDRKVTVKINI